MSGHSKWATIKHKKGAVDKARGKLFNKLARQLEVAARAGGGDPDANPTLRTAVQKAKGAQMTNDAIDRAIKRGTGEGDTGTYESIMYEGYAPGGVAMLIDVLTDNRNRTGAEIRGVFTKHGGSLAEPGAVSWQFARRGIVMVDGGADEDELMMAALEAGADDVADDGGTWRVTSDPSLTFDVRDALEAAGFTIESADAADGVGEPGADHHRRGGQEGAAGRRGDRGQRRRPGRLRQLRHPRRRHGPGDGVGLMSGVGVGDRAPDFTLPGTGGQEHSLAEYRGKPVVLVFYPGDDTPVCTKQLNAYNDGLAQFTDLGAQVLAISAQDVDSHDRFSAKHGGFEFPLLADTDKAVASAVRHARPDRLPAAQRVHRRRRRRDPLRPPGDRRADVPPGERAGGCALQALSGQHRAAVTQRVITCSVRVRTVVRWITWRRRRASTRRSGAATSRRSSTLLADDVAWDVDAPSHGIPIYESGTGKAAAAGFFTALGDLDITVFAPRNFLAGGDQVAAVLRRGGDGEGDGHVVRGRRDPPVDVRSRRQGHPLLPRHRPPRRLAGVPGRLTRREQRRVSHRRVVRAEPSTQWVLAALRNRSNTSDLLGTILRTCVR